MNKLFIILLFFCGFSFAAMGQTYSYKYIHSVKDDVKIPGLLTKGTIFYFTFTNQKSMCYLTDKNGVYSGGYGQNSYKYIGERNGVLVYKECNQNMFRNGEDLLYFSPDFSRLNWRCGFDDYSPNTNDHGCLRVLTYVANPDAIDVPNGLY